MMHLNLTRVEPKSTFYHTNGSGRDTYIASNAGGLLRKSEVLGSGRSHRPMSAQHTPRVQVNGKVLHYHSDGTGRDQYIVTNEGGLSNGNYRGGYNFIQNLRSYPKVRSQSSTGRDYFNWAQTHRPKTAREASTDRVQKDKIKLMVDRLSKPKTYQSYTNNLKLRSLSKQSASCPNQFKIRNGFSNYGL